MDRDQKVRERAYQLWEEAGRPSDRQDEFWNRAEHEMATADVTVPAESAADHMVSAEPVDPSAGVGAAPTSPGTAAADAPAKAVKRAKPAPTRSVAAGVAVTRRTEKKKT